MKVKDKWHLVSLYGRSNCKCKHMDLIEIITIPHVLKMSEKEYEDLMAKEKSSYSNFISDTPIISDNNEQQTSTLRKRINHK